MQNQFSNFEIKPTIMRSYPHRILVIEDEPSWQAIISHCLRRTKLEEVSLRFVRTSKQALDLIHSERRFDLIICDHYIDGSMTGYELWEKCSNLYLNIPFIFVSGKKKSDFLRFQSEGSPKLPIVIEKPFEPHIFTAAVNLYLNR